MKESTISQYANPETSQNNEALRVELSEEELKAFEGQRELMLSNKNAENLIQYDAYLKLLDRSPEQTPEALNAKGVWAGKLRDRVEKGSKVEESSSLHEGYEKDKRTIVESAIYAKLTGSSLLDDDDLDWIEGDYRKAREDAKKGGNSKSWSDFTRLAAVLNLYGRKPPYEDGDEEGMQGALEWVEDGAQDVPSLLKNAFFMTLAGRRPELSPEVAESVKGYAEVCRDDDNAIALASLAAHTRAVTAADIRRKPNGDIDVKWNT